MKEILMSIKPEWVAKILNGEKTIEIRKRFPKDYVGWVYIYCTKDKKYANLINRGGFLTGMVVARFWCDKVERLYEYQVDGYGSDYEIASDTLEQEELLKECCLTYDQLSDYLGDINNGCAIHITNLEIFEKPKEISEFKHLLKGNKLDHSIDAINIFGGVPLTHSPQSYCYIEI